MYSLKNLNTSADICDLINRNTELFNSFNNIYLFGSILDVDKNSNDIDLLLIYPEHSNEIINDVKIIYSAFANWCEIPIDLTVLSVEEEKDTKFLKRLKSKYLKLK